MARSAKRSVKKRQKGMARNHKRLKAKAKRRVEKLKNGPKECSSVTDAWDKQRTLKSNLDNMGLLYDANRFGAPSSLKDDLVRAALAGDSEAMDCVEAKKSSKKQAKERTPSKVVEELEAAVNEANKNNVKSPRRLSQPEIRFCIYMLDKHGEDYNAMVKDSKNIMQETASQIRTRVEKFKAIPIQYNAYLRSKGLLPDNLTSFEAPTMEIS